MIIISGLFLLLPSAQHSRLVLLKVTNPASEFRRGVSKYSASSFAKANNDKKMKILWQIWPYLDATWSFVDSAHCAPSRGNGGNLLKSETMFQPKCWMISYGLKVANDIESILLYFGGISGSGRFMKQYLLHRADTAGCWAKLKNQIKQLSFQTYL